MRDGQVEISVDCSAELSLEIAQKYARFSHADVSNLPRVEGRRCYEPRLTSSKIDGGGATTRIIRVGGGNGSLGNKKTFVPDRQLPSTSPIRETSATERPVFFSPSPPFAFPNALSLSLFFSRSLARRLHEVGRFIFLRGGGSRVGGHVSKAPGFLPAR